MYQIQVVVTVSILTRWILFCSFTIWNVRKIRLYQSISIKHFSKNAYPGNK